MPVWVLFYFTVYTTASVWVHSGGMRRRRGIWASFELLGNICLMFPGLAFWYARFADIPPEMLAFSYGFGLMATGVTLKNLWSAQYAAMRARVWRKAGQALSISLALVFLISPLVWWGAQMLSTVPL